MFYIFSVQSFIFGLVVMLSNYNYGRTYGLIIGRTDIVVKKKFWQFWALGLLDAVKT